MGANLIKVETFANYHYCQLPLGEVLKITCQILKGNRQHARQQGNTAGKATSQQNKYKYHSDKATAQQISINTIFVLRQLLKGHAILFSRFRESF